MNRKLQVLAMRIGNANKQALGAVGELIAIDLLTSAGYHVRLSKAGRKRGDLTVIDPETGQTWLVDVKTARRSTDGYFHYCLYKRNKTDYRYSDYVLLFAVNKAGATVGFLIPREDIKFATSLSLGKNARTYRGKWAQYRINKGEFQL